MDILENILNNIINFLKKVWGVIVGFVKNVASKIAALFRAFGNNPVFQTIKKMEENMGIIFLSFVMVLTIIFAIYLYWPMFAGNQDIKALKKPPTAKKIVTYPVTATVKAIPPSMVEVEKAVPLAVEAEKEVPPPTIKVVKDEVDSRSLTNPFALRASVNRKLMKGDTNDESVTTPTEEVIPELEGIWLDSNMKVAFIDQQTVSVGETVNGWRVTRIGDKTVTIQKGKRVRILKLGVE